MKKMSFKCIFNWLYAKTLNRAMSDRQPREDRAMNHSVYRPVCVSYVSRTMLVALLLLFVGGWNSEVFAAWSGSGEAVKKVGSTYYVVYDTGEYELSKGKTKDHALSGPGAGLTFDAKRNVVGSGDLLVTQNSGTSKLYSGNPGKVTKTGLFGVETEVDFQNYGSYGVDVNTTKITFKNDASISTNSQKHVKNVFVAMAQYIENPSATSLNFGEADINSTTSEKTVTVAWCNVPAMSYQITDDANGLFSVSVANNSKAGKYNTATFTVSYQHTKAGTHTAKLKITDTFNGYSKVISLSGTTNKQQPTITWSPNDETFNVDDMLSATSAPGTTVTLSSTGNESYVGCEGNKATMLAATTGKITITAHVAGNDIYANKDFTKEITITNLEKQYISWDQDFSHLKTTDGTKTITLKATSDSGLPVTYELVGDKTGLSLTQSGSVWTLTYSATECKNTTIVAKQGGDATYAPASSVSKVVKVIDPTKVCDTNETLVNSTITLKNQSQPYNIDIPSTMTINVKRTKTSWAIYSNGFNVEIYSGRNGTGTKLHEYSYSAGDINTSKTISLSNLNIAARSVKLISNASNGYDVTSVTYTKYQRSELSKTSLSFETYPSTKTSAQTFTVDYANRPITIECSNPKFEFTPESFGDCDAYGVQTISVTYTAGADEGNDVGYLYIKDNTGATLKTCTLNVSITKVSQSITSHTIKTEYKTTDRIELSAVANSKLTDFVYTASPEGVASFEGNVMTFAKEGTIAITVTQPGSNIYAATSATVENVVVSKVTPDIATNPSGTAVTYLQNLSASTLSDGSADVTLRGVANSKVDGSFAWTNPNARVEEAAGNRSYEVTFKPDDAGMYNNQTCQVAIQVNKADQTLAMNDGSVKVAVEGLDANAADSKLDLSTLIASQTTDPVNNNRVGAVTYKVISANASNATINGNIFSATAIGNYTIRATKAETDYYNVVTDDFVVKVSKRANTMAIAGTEYEKFVDEEIADIRSLQNSDATVQTSSDFPTIARYDVASNTIVIPNDESDYQMFGSQKTVKIKIWQEETDRFEALDTLRITLTVNKYETTKSGEDITLKVNETVTGNYSFTNTSAEYPSDNLNADFYYTIDAPSFDNEALNNGNQLISYDPETKQITGYNAGTTKITFFQKETYKYTGATLMCNVTVEKRDNQIKNSWGDDVWQKAMSESGTSTISFTSTHEDYTNYPISIERIYGEDVATLTGNAACATITTNTTKGYAIWHVSQVENYEYSSAEADVIVTVGVPAPPTCYVYQDNSEHEFATGIGDAEGHFETPIAINSPVDKIWFNAKRQLGGVNKFVVQYSKDNGKNWSTLLSPSLDTKYKSSAFSATFPTMQGTERITHVRFGAKTGATLSKWYKDVQISRRSYLNLQDAEKNKISKLPTMTCTIDENSIATAKFYIDYSTCADEITIESSNPDYFTVSRSSINVSEKHDNLTSAKEEITVTFKSSTRGTYNAVITVRTNYQTRALSVTGEATRRTPELIWQEGFQNNPLTLPVGLTVSAINPAATATSGASVKYESNDESVIQIIEEGYAFRVIKAGSAVLTATAPENEQWESVSGTRVINATDKIVQEIVWNQSFPRFMKPGNEIDLEAKVYLRNLTTNELTYSAERTPYINYTCPTNNGIVSVSGTKMTVLGYGEVKVTAAVSGNANYAAAASVIMLINVRQPSVGCETPLVLNRTDIIDMFEVDVDFSNYFNLTTEEMVSDEIAIDHANGKPDKLSFQYAGEEFNAYFKKYFGGFIKFEQHVNGNWIAVENSRVETVKNEWNTKSNLQLDENADALRIIRESGATGHHYIKDIQVTRKQYLRATKNTIDLGEVTLGQATPVTIGFEYSDIKGDLTARTINNTTDVTIKDNGAIDLDCGSFGHYGLPVTFTPTKLGDWQGEVEIYDNIANLSIAVKLTATVVANEEYIFNHEGDWNTATNWTTNLVPDENADITVVKNMTINSAANVKSITIMDSATVTVKSGVTLVVGSGTPKNLPAYGNLHVEEGAQVLLDEEASLPLNDLILDAKLGTTNPNKTIASNSGQITNESQLIVNGDAYFRLAVDPSGHNTYGWYDFTVPFEVDVIGGISIAEEPSAVMKFNDNYAVMDYSEAKRAVNGKYWNKFTGTMLPGHIYTITLDADKPWNTVVFKKKADVSATGDRSYITEYSGLGADNKDNGWNGFGNGTLHHTELDVPAGTLIQVYDHANKCYHTREAKDYSIAVGMTFVMQVPSVQTITLLTATSNSRFLAPARESSETDKFRLSLQAEGAENASDYLWVSASEDATGDYIIGRDVMKMGTMSASNVARIWSVRNSLNLCSNEMPMVNGEASCPLNIYAPVAGSYTLAIDKAPEDANLYLTYNGNVIWDLTASPYTLDLTKGTTAGYGLQLEVVNAPLITTGVDEIGGEKDGNRKVIINDAMYIITKEGAIFNATGKKVK